MTFAYPSLDSPGEHIAMKTKHRRSRIGTMVPRLLTQGSRRHQRRREVYKVRPNPTFDEPVGTVTAVTEAPPSEVSQSVMIIDNISQLSDNYDLVEAVACSLFDQIALPRR